MATKLFGQVVIGGNAVNNPSNYDWSSYRDYPDAVSGRDYQRVNVIFFSEKLNVPMQVTGLAEIEAGHAKTGFNDVCLIPCPPEC